MPTDGGNDGDTALSPDEAFGVLGDETRMEILQALGEADGPLAFSELFDRVEYDTTANFSYHLEKLEGHFVQQTENGYRLRQAGKRVVKAVLSGAVTEAPELEPTTLEEYSCPYCGGDAVIGYTDERVWTACPDCEGTYGRSYAPGNPLEPEGYGYLGHLRLPPAGLQRRSASEVLNAGIVWGYLDFLSMAHGVCPRCGGVVASSVSVCEEHDAESRLCDRCDRRHAVQLNTRCTNCIHEEMTPFVLGQLIATTEFLGFLAEHGVNPAAPPYDSGFYETLVDYEEEVLSVDPFEARFTVTFDGDSRTFAVDDELSTVDVTKKHISD